MSQSQGGEAGKGSAGEGGEASDHVLKVFSKQRSQKHGRWPWASLRARVREEREGRGQQGRAGRLAAVFSKLLLTTNYENTVAGLGPPFEPESGRRGLEGVSRGEWGGQRPFL